MKTLLFICFSGMLTILLPTYSIAQSIVNDASVITITKIKNGQTWHVKNGSRIKIYAKNEMNRMERTTGTFNIINDKSFQINGKAFFIDSVLILRAHVKSSAKTAITSLGVIGGLTTGIIVVASGPSQNYIAYDRVIGGVIISACIITGSILVSAISKSFHIDEGFKIAIEMELLR